MNEHRPQPDTELARSLGLERSLGFWRPGRLALAGAVAALLMAAAVFADRLSEYGISVHEVRPGIIKTDMTAAVEAKYDKLIAEGLVPQKRWGTPEDVGKAVAGLVNGSFPYSTGTVIEVSGGMNLRRL
jgi:NAD(P)-dependent dehydrogenase (short-subunit alcohol dehydrogenase family)